MKFIITALEKVRDVIEADDAEMAEKRFRAKYPATTEILAIDDDGYYPEYVRVGDMGGIALQLVREGRKKSYYRIAGEWECNVKMVKGKLLVDEPEGHLEHMNNLPLLETSREDWASDNQGYVPGEENEKI